MGEITREIPKATNIPGKKIGKLEQIKEKGLTGKTSWEAEQIANNPEILDRVIKNSEERGEIPTKTAVLNTIRTEKEKSSKENG